MKKIISCFSIFFILVSFCSAAKKQKNKAPLWVTDEGRLEMFPPEEYVSCTVFGSSIEESKAKAAADISNQIKVTVDSTTTASSSLTQDSEGFNSTKRQISESIELTGSNPVYQLEYTTPFFNSDMGVYVCTAYINRKQAWDFIEPKLSSISKAFIDSYTQALKLDDPLKKLTAVNNSCSVLEEFYKYYDFGIVVNKTGAAKYKKADDYAYEAFILMKKLPSECVLSIDVINDNNKKVYSRIAEILTKEGYLIDSDKYIYKLTAEVTTGIENTGDLWVSYPSINIEIKNQNKNETVEAYSKQFEKISGFEEETCKKKVYKEIDNYIANQFMKGEK